jgi:hypothetical protein
MANQASKSKEKTGSEKKATKGLDSLKQHVAETKPKVEKSAETAPAPTVETPAATPATESKKEEKEKTPSKEEHKPPALRDSYAFAILSKEGFEKAKGDKSSTAARFGSYVVIGSREVGNLPEKHVEYKGNVARVDFDADPSFPEPFCHGGKFLVVEPTTYRELSIITKHQRDLEFAMKQVLTRGNPEHVFVVEGGPFSKLVEAFKQPGDAMLPTFLGKRKAQLVRAAVESIKEYVLTSAPNAREGEIRWAGTQRGLADDAVVRFVMGWTA